MAVFAVQAGGAGQDALLVPEVALGHRDRRGGRRIESRTGLEQPDDLGAAVPRALDDAVERVLVDPAHLHQVRQRHAGDGGIAHCGHHGVAVAAEDEGGDVLHRDVHLLGEEIAEARAVEHAGHADDPVVGQAAMLAQGPDHGVERVGDADDEGVRRMLADARADRLHDLGVGADQVVAAHARLARHARGDDDDVGPGDRRIVRRAGQAGVEALDRRGLGEVQRLALRHAFNDVEQHDIAQLLEAGEQGQRAADLAGADQGDLVSSHGNPRGVNRRASVNGNGAPPSDDAGGISATGRARQPRQMRGGRHRLRKLVRRPTAPSRTGSRRS